MDVQTWLTTIFTDGPGLVVDMVSALLNMGFMWLLGPIIAFEIAALVYEYVIRGGRKGER